ncbi:D-alanyl-D-alanine carboxypeptidase/D-alanyl-D-alanine endopeptidase [Evansella cellulosilytica]|uniref:D-alanyl-D-alanine carboxypeptidase/D-alanyl-D-alanine-endopeptidase n=1 Tax=Evansella cellulosilytica (strain ATCC 21833 / DSM 2522 / FERM P-1141 / JCM 9156 / N-4) TaxID=649639 RepID=E6TR98_EVAC2|nr:D-alanyl-D-alanine carboxypeptidase/D-alanyl-D-alanine-endopeptidase [Evansella cellulosilytica]ADU30610.1 D-alanyl-D-alanine carboxypeptidase/D-alanyl-D-alanine-endopeptidase [Evansella cellulosilytica DSM 2522]
MVQSLYLKSMCLLLSIILLYLIFIPYSEAAALDTLALKEDLDELIIHHSDINHGKIGVSVRSFQTGELLYEQNVNQLLTPASNMKILTSIAALELLGPNYHFTTELLIDGNTRWQLLKGNVYIKGKGDATLLPTDIEKLVSELKQQGIKYIFGDIVADDSWFDSIRHPIDMPWSDEMYGYGAPISALTVAPKKNVEGGTIIIEIMPNEQIGQPAVIKTVPDTEYVEVINESITVTDSERNNISIKKKHGTNQIYINGHINQTEKKIEKLMSVWEPTNYVLHLFSEYLKKEEIRHLGNVTLGDTPKEAKLFTVHHSSPLSELLFPFMKYSDNVLGESITKEMGKFKYGDGSWECGLRALQEALAHYDMKTENTIIRDGSGISHVNAISTNDITKLLYEIKKEHWFPLFKSSLPISGHDSKYLGGTLKDRFTNSRMKGKVKAKTGTLTSVSSLSGYLETKGEESIIFSIITNDITNSKKAKMIEEEITMVIADYLN